MKRNWIALLAVVVVLTPGGARAGVVVVTDVSGLPSSTSWGTLPGEDTGGGSGVVSGTAPRSGDGSIELRGDRSRVQIGIQYAPFTTNLGPLSSVTGLTFDWRIAGDSTNPYNVDYTPALRLLVQDGNQRSELIWEGAYNGTYGNTARDTWYSTTVGDNFYQNVAGAGVTLENGSQVNKTLAAWISQNYSSQAYVAGISVGVGSGASANYHAFADDVTLDTTSGSTTYNFEVSAAGAVPEPASGAMMLIGCGITAAAARRKRRGVGNLAA